MRFFLVVTVFLCQYAVAQTLDSSFFRSDFEKKQIENAASESRDIMALLMAFDGDENKFKESQSRLNKFYLYVNQLGLPNKSPKAFSKGLFKEVHSHFFVKYEDIASFGEIFEKGYYNCVSATALFAVILDHYSVPFQIKELPSHVYLVAYPGVHNILFEATNPNGFYVPDSKAKESYVNDLLKLKLITQEYINKVGYPRAFEEMYYSQDNIDLVQLASFQYYNQALTLYQEEKAEEAIPYILKAYSLSPATRIEYLKISLISGHLQKSNLDGPKDMLYLTELGNSLKDDGMRTSIIKIFESYIYQKLFKNSNDSLLNSSYDFLRTNLKDSLLKNEITHRYNIGFADWYRIKGRLEESLKYARVAYKYNPNDVTIQELISAVLLKRVTAGIGRSDNLEKLTEFSMEFPFLKDNPYFESLYATNYAYLAYKNFETDQKVEGYRYMKLLEDAVEKLGEELIVPDNLLAMVYAEAGAHHYRQREYHKAREIILRGFKYAPDDEELQARLEIVEKELK